MGVCWLGGVPDAGSGSLRGRYRDRVACRDRPAAAPGGQDGPERLAFCDNTRGEPLAWMLREGPAGSNTTAGHVKLVNEAIAALPHRADRPAADGTARGPAGQVAGVDAGPRPPRAAAPRRQARLVRERGRLARAEPKNTAVQAPPHDRPPVSKDKWMRSPQRSAWIRHRRHHRGRV
jgi:hypothetical protein